MFNRKLNSAFCCMDIRTGAKVIGFLSFFCSTLDVIGALSGSVTSFEEYVKTLGNGTDESKDTEETAYSVYYSYLAQGLLRMLFDASLVYGLFKRKPSFMLPWLVIYGLVLIVGTIIALILVGVIWFMGEVGVGFLILGFFVIWFMVEFYSFKVVQSEWFNLRDPEHKKTSAVQLT